MLSSNDAIKQNNNQLLSSTMNKVLGKQRRPMNRPMSSYGKPPVKPVIRKFTNDHGKRHDPTGQNSADLSADSLYRYTIASPVNMVSNNSTTKQDLSHRPVSGIQIDHQKPSF